MTISDSDSFASFEGYLKRLQYYSSLLRWLSLAVIGMTLVNFCLLIYGVIQRVTYTGSVDSYSYPSFISTLVVIMVVSASLTVATIIALVVFESVTKRGDALFQELSNEFQTTQRDKLDSGTIPPLAVRLALRNFAASSELPLFAGRSGSAFYAAINLALVIFMLWFLFK